VILLVMASFGWAQPRTVCLDSKKSWRDQGVLMTSIRHHGVVVLRLTKK
jgi:hypothetical protein